MALTNQIQYAENATLLSISKLDGLSFEIPSYQRGFRWDKQQIKELLDDLANFSSPEQKNGGVYCLQPVSVRKKIDAEENNIYEVIDGQQRLTALWLLATCYKHSSNFTETMPYEYSLSYVGKDDYTQLIYEINQLPAKKERDLRSILTKAKGDIDSQNLVSLFTYVLDEYQWDGFPFFQVLNQIFCYGLKLGKDIQIIWGEIDVVNAVSEEIISSTIIDKFTNINANKIPLTESELVKAMVLSSVWDNKHKVLEISNAWEEMERALNDDEFWYFFTRNTKQYEPRMDALLEIWYASNPEYHVLGGEHIISRAAKKYIEDTKVNLSENAVLLWDEITDIFDLLKDWYHDYFLFHTIGLIIETSDENSVASFISDMKTLCIDGNMEGKFKKTDFNEYIIEKIKGLGWLKQCIKNEGGQFVSQKNDISLKYNYQEDKENIKRILLLYNIALLVNAQKTSNNSRMERFSFAYYKNRFNPIEVEHINPQHPEGSNYNRDDRIKWVEDTIDTLDDQNKQKSFKNELEKIKENPKQHIEKLSSDLENYVGTHYFNNLTLIDKELNIKFSNNSFNIKKNHVVSAKFGLLVDESDQNSMYKKSVIFPGTRWVFFREYKNASSETYWTKNDRESYEDSVRTAIFGLLFGNCEEE